MRHLVSCVAAIMMLAGVVRAEIIDRVLAAVGGDLIMLSDVSASLRFGLIEPDPAEKDRRAAALNALIERQLQVTEVNRYLPPEPPDAAIDARLTAIRAGFRDPDAFDAALSESGLTLGQLRGFVRDDLRLASYREQRFGAALMPTDEDVMRYYRAHEARFVRDGVLAPFREVRDEARQLLIAERSQTLIRDWIDALRRRTVVTVLPLD